MSRIYLGGVPTRPDVERLLAELNAEPGTSIAFEEVEGIIGVGWQSARFTTVTGAWRRHLFREKGIQVKREGGAFHLLTADGSQDECVRGLGKVVRSARRLRIRVDVIDQRKLSKERRERQRLLSREVQAIEETAAKSRMLLAAPNPVDGSSVRLLRDAAES